MKNYLSCRSTSAYTSLALVLFTASGCLVVKAALFRPEATNTASQRTLTFADRVAYQRAVEKVYWRHRIWPKENPRPKPSLDEVMSQEQIKQKVEEYLRKSQLLADQWQQTITPEQLQAEMERMASHTRQPEVLRELFAALGNDPFIIAECLAKLVLSERLVGELHAGSNPPAETESLGSWAAKTETESSVTTEQPESGYYLPEIASSRIEDPAGGCVDHWTATSTTNAPSARAGHTAVWTGTEMIVWGGWNGVNSFNTGGRYNPVTDTWTATSIIGAPSPRTGHTAIWTGTEMIVWGGSENIVWGGVTTSTSLNTGGRYNPITNSWIATTTRDASHARRDYTAVWTGTEMIVWGGWNGVNSYSGSLNTGDRYNPSTDRWVAISRTGAPCGRQRHTAVWTGTEMIIWGGAEKSLYSLNSGFRYNPNTDSWVAISRTGAPCGRQGHTAVWTGTEMIVCGGTAFGSPTTGGRYNPSTDNWVATTTNNAPDGRGALTAVWTGTEMIVWGGWGPCCKILNTGGRYNPSTDSWVATTTAGAPAAGGYHTAVWTGTEMIVWGGFNNDDPGNTGARYVPCTESRVATTTIGAPDARQDHTAVWTGTEMIVCGGLGFSCLNTDGKYSP